MLLLICCLCPSNWLWRFCVCLCLVCITLCLFLFSIILKRKRELVAFVVIRMSYYCICAVILPYGAVGWSAVCDCGIS